MQNEAEIDQIDGGLEWKHVRLVELPSEGVRTLHLTEWLNKLG